MMKTKRSNYQRHNLRKPARPHQFEWLEERTPLDGGGIAAYLSMSFAPDDTAIGTQSNQLFAEFDQIAPAAQWQTVIEQAFNQWAIHTNADIAVVQDEGQSFGTPGRREGDSRFGDVRVGAAPLADSVWAVSFPTDSVALGTWSSDIVFNSNLDWTLDRLASVALHEAGHIFGLEHNADPTSAMHTHGASNVLTPTAEDIGNLQQLYGQRSVDPNESEEDGDDNDFFENATQLTNNLGEETLSLSYGDISTVGDVDLFRIDTEDEIEGVILIRVETNGLSRLDAIVELYNEDEELLESETTEDGIALLEYELEDDEESLFIRVKADVDARSPVGRYAIVTTLMEEDFDDDDYDDFAAGELFSLNGSELADYLRSEGDFSDEDDVVEIEFASAKPLIPSSTNAGRTWYEKLGTISGGSDIYAIEHPEIGDEDQDVLTVSIQSLTVAGLIPTVAILDSEGDEIPTNIVANGNGELMVQTKDVEEEMFLVITAENPEGPFAVGNYKLLANFGSSAVELDDFSVGSFTASETVQARQLFVASPQLFHFLLEVPESQNASQVVVTMDLFDEAGNTVYQLASTPDLARSGANPLLRPGTYTLRIGVEGQIDEGESIAYSLLGLATSNPLGIVPVDPTNEPSFQCDGVKQEFCYPGGRTSDSPFFWDAFIRDYVDQKKKNGPPISSSAPDFIWWEWYFQDGLNQPSTQAPSTSTDSYRVRDSALTVSNTGGLLSNDTSLDNTPLVVALAQEPANGTLNLATDGSFTYLPDPGFFGTDVFSYQAFNFGTPSIATDVNLQISRPGDVDDDGSVEFSDFLRMSQNFGNVDAVWSDGDLTGDGVVGFEDFLILAANFGQQA